MTCASCGTSLAADADPRRTTCGQPCRSRLYRERLRRRDEEFRSAAIALVLMQTEAILAGDADALAQVLADAERLFAA